MQEVMLAAGEVMLAAGEVMLAAEEVMLAAVKTCLPACRFTFFAFLRACLAGVSTAVASCCSCLFCKLRETDMLTEKP